MTGLLRHLAYDRRGNVLMLTGLLFFVLLGAAGASIDLGRQQLVRIKLQHSADAAALAGALAPDGADRQAVALRYFNMNFPAKYMGVTRPVPQFPGVANAFKVTAEATVPTTFMRFLGKDMVVADGSSNTMLAASETQSYDLLLSIDVSGSMSYADVEGGRPVPAVSLNAARANGVRLCQLTGLKYPCADYGNGPSTQDGKTIGYGLTGNTRLNAVREAAMTIARQMLESGVKDNESRLGLVTWSGAGELVLPLTTESSKVYTAIDQMAAFGGTNSMEGMRLANQALVNSNPKHVRAIVLLTDGKNTQRGQLYQLPSGRLTDLGYPPCNGFDMCRPANERTLPMCNAAKDSGYLIYTVAFGSEVSGTTGDAVEVQNFLSSCASGVAGSNRNEYFFVAPNAATLQQVFAVILQQVQKVRIVE